MDKEYKREEYISINKVAEAKGLKSNSSIRLELNKPESKYISEPAEKLIKTELKY